MAYQAVIEAYELAQKQNTLLRQVVQQRAERKQNLIKSYRKKPMTVRAFQWSGYGPVSLDELGVIIRRSETIKPIYQLFNPGTGKWQEIERDDYVVIAPTGCRYPVKPEQFERNYEEPALV